MKKQLSLITFFFLGVINAQNLLNTNTWTAGSGSASGYSQNGSTSENSREYGADPWGNSVVLWKATPDSNRNADGGWVTSNINIDHTKTYRLTVWIKKTNSNNGSTYFGFYSPNNGLTLDGTVNNNPYFWYGDLPKLNRWYLLVGYVHGSNYKSGINYGAIYDGITGEKVRNIKDYKFKNTATIIRHRAYLFYDTNTSDRQYFFAPRIDLVSGSESSLEEILDIKNVVVDNNLLNTNLWTVGSGSIGEFSQKGGTSENSRLLGKNHVGKEVVLWKASPDKSSNADGGWNSSHKPINHADSYRLSVWIKKTNSNNGSTYFGFYSPNNGLTLDGTVNNNPYFWYGDLPKLNRWYLLVGYVHKSSYSSTANLGAMYDGVTGEKVKTITDFKFKNTATKLIHRAYLYYDTNILDEQYFYAPRIDKITGTEPTIDELLQINDESKLIVSLDLAGNQKQAFYCNNPQFCAPPSARKAEKKESVRIPTLAEAGLVEGMIAEPTQEEIEDIENYKNQKIKIYPNPTSSIVNLDLIDFNDNIHSISLYNANSVFLKKIDFSKKTSQLDLSNMSTGTYFIHIHLKQGKSITKKIIKK